MRPDKKHPNDKVLKPIRPNLGIEAGFRARLRKLVRQMHADVVRAISTAYEANPPEMVEAMAAQDAQPSQGAKSPLSTPQTGNASAQKPVILGLDASPAAELRKIIRRMAQKWQKRFDDLAPKLARYFSEDIGKRSDKALAKMLRKAGITVKFKMTAAQQDALEATIGQQVGLIKSIPTQYLQRVEGQVMRSVTNGHSLGTLTKALQKDYDLSYKRAALIARDQNAKAAATMLRTRQLELGIKEAIWRHSGGGKEPRPLHVKWGRERKRFDVAKGMWDSKEQKWIQPGELINCKCISQSVIAGIKA